MTSRRFCALLLFFSFALVVAIVNDGSAWRWARFPILGFAICFVVSWRRVMEYFHTQELVGTAVQRGKIESRPSAAGFFWAGRSLSFKEACQHFLAVGATGAGKSITLNLLMQSVLTKLGKPDAPGEPVPRRRAVVYDSKTDLVSLVAGLVGGMQRLFIMNPLDHRVTPWAISTDITTEADADEFAAMLITKNERESSPYFTDTARALVAGVVKRFMATAGSSPKAWTLRDVILAFESTARLGHVLDHPHTNYLQEHFSTDNAKNYAGVKSTADTHLARFRSVAALLSASKAQPVSLNAWVKDGEGVMVIGNHELAREATDTLNGLILQRLSKVLIAREGVLKNDQTWIFLDELREAGVLHGLRQLLLRGRSKAVAVVMGFQDVEGIFAAYGPHEGAELIGAAQNVVMLHLNPSAPNTTKWASDVFSSRRAIESSQSMNIGAQSESWGQQRSAQLVPNVYPIQFVELPMPSSKGLSFYSFTNEDGYRCTTYPWADFIEKEGYFRFVDTKQNPDFMLQTDPQKFRLLPWSDPEDYRRLGLTKEQQTVMRPAPKDPTELLNREDPVLH